MRKSLSLFVVCMSLIGAAHAFSTLPSHLIPAPSGGGSPARAPEIDPASAVGALTLLAGGLAALRGRRGKRE